LVGLGPPPIGGLPRGFGEPSTQTHGGNTIRGLFGKFVGQLVAKLRKLINFSVFGLFGSRKRLERGF